MKSGATLSVDDRDVICEGDCCQDAVRRSYREMREKGESEPHAMNVALTVFRWHHPEVEARHAKDTVSLWVHEGTMH